MKPKNRVFCYDCGKKKLLFETEKKALTFIKFNGDEIEAEKGYKPQRAYYCVSCGGYHVTSNKTCINTKSPSEKMIEYVEEFVERYKKNRKRSKTN